MNRSTVFPILLAVLVVSSAKAHALEKTIVLRNVTISVPIEYKADRDAWARYMLSKTADYLAATEEYLDTPFRFSEGFTIKACDECGSMNASEVFIGYSDSPALLFHELAHFWYGYAPGEIQANWLVEGINSFLPLAMRIAGTLTLSEAEYRGIWEAWSFRQSFDASSDMFLSHERAFSKDESERYERRYSKSFKVQYLLYMELGEAGYRRFLRLLLTEKPRDEEAILDLLYAIKPQDWAAFLSGWIFQGEYTRVGPESFRDSDADRLLDVEEHYLGTRRDDPDSDDDGYSDYWEHTHSYDPNSDAGSRLSSSPVIDGVAEDMERLPDYVINDPSSDNKGSSDINYVEVYRVASDPDRHYVRIFFYTHEVRNSYHTLHIRRSDGHNYWIQAEHPVNHIWASEFIDGVRFEDWRKIEGGIPGIYMQFCEVFEAIIDLKSLIRTSRNPKGLKESL